MHSVSLLGRRSQASSMRDQRCQDAVLTAAWIANGIVAGLTASVISLEL
jgi:hypothetical protein